MANFGERYVAEVSADGKHLRLFSEMTMSGAMALVYDLKAKRAVFQENADDLKQGQEKCEECAKGLLVKRPKISWTHQP